MNGDLSNYILHLPHLRPKLDHCGNEDWMLNMGPSISKDREKSDLDIFILFVVTCVYVSRCTILLSKILISNKLMVLDLATGKKNVEEWPIDIEYESLETFMFTRNFFFMNLGVENDILVLNMESKKEFRMQRSILENQIREKTPDVDEDGEPFNINNMWRFLSETTFVLRGLNSFPINPDVNTIEIVYRMELGIFVLYGSLG